MVGLWIFGYMSQSTFRIQKEKQHLFSCTGVRKPFQSGQNWLLRTFSSLYRGIFVVQKTGLRLKSEKRPLPISKGEEKSYLLSAQTSDVEFKTDAFHQVQKWRLCIQQPCHWPSAAIEIDLKLLSYIFLFLGQYHNKEDNKHCFATTG